MGAQGLGSRAVIGMFFAALEQYKGSSWVTKIGGAEPFDSDQESETYKWLGQAPMMREWIGGRNAKGFRENGLTIFNKKFEATQEIPVDWLRRDKTGQVRIRMAELAQRELSHWGQLLSILIANGTGANSGLCYDGEYFFDNDHSEGDSGTQTNLLTATEVPALAVTADTAPSAKEAVEAILGVIAHMLGIKDDQGEPMNSEAKNFLIMTSPAMWARLLPAVSNPVVNQGDTNTLASLSADGFSISIAANPRLTYTTQFACFRTDAPASALIRQQEEDLQVDYIGAGSEEEFKNDRHLIGLKAMRNAGYGFWQYAAHATFSAIG